MFRIFHPVLEAICSGRLVFLQTAGADYNNSYSSDVAGHMTGHMTGHVTGNMTGHVEAVMRGSSLLL